MSSHEPDPVDPQAATGGEPAGVPVGHGGVRVGVEERAALTANGYLPVILTIAGFIGAIRSFIYLAERSDAGLDAGPWGGIATALVILTGLLAASITVVSPGDTRVLQLFGRYIGTVRRPGLSMTVPLARGRRVSVKVRNFETNELKVNDADGNPVNIAAIIVWQVADTAKAVFAVERYDDFVRVQAESALRHVATSHPYDNAGPGTETLRGSTEVVAQELATEVAARIAIAGLEVVEARISSLSYAPEIAHAMLQRQQATAVIAAREKIVEGAVSMVQSALRQLEADDVVTMDDERKAAMVSNLLVVLCSSSQATPVINTGSLYT